MTPIDPQTLEGLPAPFWFIELFKILGFILHSIPMHLWLVGVPLAVLLMIIGGQNAKRFSRRLFKQFPVIFAIGINLGIVPFLFIQTAYYKAFYSSTILIAVHWLSILLLVLTAYYLLYAASFAVEKPQKRQVVAFGTMAALCLIAVGLIFSSAWTLMASPSDWIPIWEKTSFGGAVTGLGTYWNNPFIYFRFASIVGLAFLTMSFWAVFDAYVLCRTLPLLVQPVKTSSKTVVEIPTVQNVAAPAGTAIASMSKKEKRRALKKGTLTKEEIDADQKDSSSSDQNSNERSATAKQETGTLKSYRNWVLSFATSLASIGLLIAGTSLWGYFEPIIPFKTLITDQLGEQSFYYAIGNNWFLLKVGTLASLFLPFLLLFIGKHFLNRNLLVFLLLISEVVILAFFATTRQVIQNYQLIDYLNVAQLDAPTAVQWNPLVCFLSILGIGLLTICWMIRQMVVARRGADKDV